MSELQSVDPMEILHQADEPGTEESNEKIPEDTTSIKDFLNGHSLDEIGNMLANLRDILKILESNWKEDVRTFHLTHDQMEKLYQYNITHRTPKPENPVLDEEGKEIPWDATNGVKCLTEEEAFEIFGENHRIIGITHDVTMDRVTDVFDDFYNWITALTEYKSIDKEFRELVNEKEDQQIQLLAELIKNETDPEKQEKMQKSMDLYYDRRQLRFLSTALDDEGRKRLVSWIMDENKLRYTMNRLVDKMKQMGYPAMIIAQLSQFESSILEEKYHKCDGIMLMYYASLIIYGDRNSTASNHATLLMVQLDALMRNQLSEQDHNIILNNLHGFLDPFLELIPDPPVDARPTEPIQGNPATGNDPSN